MNVDTDERPLDGSDATAGLPPPDSLRDITTRFSQATGFTIEFLDQWQATSDTLGDAMWLMGIHQRIVRANTAAGKLFNRPSHALLGRLCFEIVHATSEPIPDCPLMRAARSLRRETMELQRGEQWFLVAVSPLRSTTGHFAGAVHVVSDITEHKKLETCLRESEERYRTLFEDATDGLLVADAETKRFVMCNPRICHMLGYSSDELKRLTISDIHLAEHLPRVADALTKIACGEIDLASELPVRRKDGTLFFAEISTRPTVVNGQHCILGVFRDVTERLQAEKALRHSEAMLKQSQHVAKLGHYELDVAAGIWSSSEALDDLFGLDASFQKNIEGWGALLHPDDRDDTFDYLRNHVLKEGHPFEREYRIVRPIDGAVRWVYGLGELEVTSTGQAVRMFGVIQDITERKHSEEERKSLENQVQQSQKLESLGLLAGGIAHDFNNLLTGIIGNVDLALSDTPAASPARQNLLEIDQTARRAADLCRQMLAYSGKGRFVVQRIDLRDLVDETNQMLTVAIPKKVVLRRNFATKLPTIEADVTQIRQVLMNLVINASEAIGEQSGEITLSTGVTECSRNYLTETYVGERIPEGNYVYFEVADTGCGMDESTCRHMFEPFFTSKFTGRGLGLAAVLGIVRGHKGAIKVSSEQGKGTRVRVLLPAVDGPVTRLPEKINEAGRQSWSGTVLVVDDEAVVRTVAKRFLERMGFRVILAEDGAEAVTVFRNIETEEKGRIVCVLLDLTMPRMDGAETFRQIRRLRGDVPVLLSSGYDEHELMQRFGGSGMAGFVQKPYRLNDLAAKIQEALRH